MQKSVGLCLAALSIGCAGANLRPGAEPVTPTMMAEREVLKAEHGGANVTLKHDADGTAAFEKIKALAGEWQARNGKDLLTEVFRPIAYGTAVVDQQWVNGTENTVTVFYLVDGELRADHFCDYENQPRYAAIATTDSNVVAFELRDITNARAHPKHYHAATWRFIDANHHTQEWRAVENGAETDTVRLEFTRTR